MTLRNLAAVLAAGLMLAACGQTGDDTNAKADAAAPAANETAANETAARNALAGGTEAPPCPFRRTRDWVGSVERGHVRINGYVDVQMAGFRPGLTERSGAPAGTLALDLAFQPAPGEPISDHARYERLGAPPYRRAEIWCGGERIEQIDMTVVQ